MPSGIGDLLLGDYIDNTTYNQFGLPNRVQLNTGTIASWVGMAYDEHTTGSPTPRSTQATARDTSTTSTTPTTPPA
jgi:hypothetical protein